MQIGEIFFLRVLVASDHSVDYACGRCSTILLQAEKWPSPGFPDLLHEVRAVRLVGESASVDAYLRC
jgi:hypothetical protein